MIVTELFTNRLDSAIHALREGKFILLHDSDSRENEVDMIVAAEHVTPDQIKAMRTDAGGLVCVALGNDVGKEIGITYLYDILLAASEKQVIPRSLLEEFATYGGRSAFSITVNHRRTFTGITDRDRALTIMELARLAKTAANGGDGCKEAFASDFKAPGHVHLLLESEG
jgi:3,4-dihydroxy 2-butanone 4-phosphate synthase